MRKVIILICTVLTVIFVVSALVLHSSASLVEKEKNTETSPTREKRDDRPISSFTDDECMQFLKDNGIEIPEGVNQDLLKQNIKELFLRLSEQRYTVINSRSIHDFELQIAKALQDYMNLSEAGQNRDSLQYSTFYSWSSDMNQYNCYAYAIRSTNRFDVFIEPGDFSSGSYIHTDYIYTVANIVKEDLIALNHKCVRIQTTTPTTTTGWLNVIAVRKDTTGDYNGYNDFHFAKLSSNNWFHKPSWTAVLVFNNAPTNAVVWTNESVVPPFIYEYSITYDSDIYYLLYKDSHTASTGTWTGQHYHSGNYHHYLYSYTCPACGDEYEEWISMPCNGHCILPWGIDNPTT